MGNDQPTLNPWFLMWTKPRATIQQIVDRMSQLEQIENLSPKIKRQSIKNLKGRILVFISGFSRGLDKFSIDDSNK